MSLATSLQSNHLPVIVINPQRVRDFARAIGVLGKANRIGTRMLALFGLQVKPEVRQLPDKQAREMDSLLTLGRQLVEMLTSEHNRLLQAYKDIA